jgi:hypothetical protein
MAAAAEFHPWRALDSKTPVAGKRVSATMSQEFLDVLSRHAAAGELEKLDPVARELDNLSLRLATVLSGLQDSSARQDLLAQFDARVLGSLKEIEEKAVRPGTSFPSSEPNELPSGKLTPELREWARQQFSEEEIVAGLQELRDKGGLELGDFLKELEDVVARP